ncbi:MAG: polysaccharide export protein [Leptolyngbya sp. SIO4C1]|nr:polysaccharide export protein [Leptolyngbya sp. SIO4C1]
MHKFSQPLSRPFAIAFGLLCLSALPAAAQSLPDLSEETSQAAPPAVVTPALGSAASAYILGPGDQIEVRVYGFEEYTGPVTILPDGTITLPLVGKVPAAGRTTEQLTQELTVILDRLLVDPYVSVTLNALRPVVVNVSGEVYRPGPIQLQGETSTVSRSGGEVSGPPSVSTALVQAGGVTRMADIRDVVVMRALPSGQTVRTQVNLWDALWSETLPEDLLLRDGDLVFVPRLEEGELLDRRLLARSSLSPETVRVRVVGEVTDPGEVPVPPNSSLSSAIAIAGGPTEDAKLSEVAFIRMNDAGEVEQEVVDLRNLVDTYQVQDGDVVVVPKSTTGSVLDFAQRLLGPLNFLFRIFE